MCCPQEILPDFFRNFWVRRMALDRRNYRQLVDTTVCIARKVCWLPPGCTSHSHKPACHHAEPYHIPNHSTPDMKS